MGARTVKPKVQNQGKAVCERQADGTWMVMLPNGQIIHVAKKETAELRCKSYFHVHNDPTQIGVGQIEWRF